MNVPGRLFDTTSVRRSLEGSTDTTPLFKNATTNSSRADVPGGLNGDTNHNENVNLFSKINPFQTTLLEEKEQNTMFEALETRLLFKSPGHGEVFGSMFENLNDFKTELETLYIQIQNEKVALKKDKAELLARQQQLQRNTELDAIRLEREKQAFSSMKRGFEHSLSNTVSWQERDALQQAQSRLVALSQQLEQQKAQQVVDSLKLAENKASYQLQADAISTLNHRTEEELKESQKKLAKQFLGVESMKGEVESLEKQVNRDMRVNDEERRRLAEERAVLETGRSELRRRRQELDKLINPKQFIERERALTKREASIAQRDKRATAAEENAAKQLRNLEKREDALAARQKSVDEERQDRVEQETLLRSWQRALDERERLLAQRKQGLEERRKEVNTQKHFAHLEERFTFQGHGFQNHKDKAKYLFQKESQLLQKEKSVLHRERDLKMREDALKERETRSGFKDLSVQQQNIDAAHEEIIQERNKVAADLEVLLKEKKSLNDLRRLTHKAQQTFDRETKKERERLSAYDEKLRRIEAKYGDDRPRLLRLDEEEQDLLRRGEELVLLYEDLTVQEELLDANKEAFKKQQTLLLEDQKKLQDVKEAFQKEFVSKKRELLANKDVVSENLDDIKDLKTQISHIIIKEQIEWTQYPELREQVTNLIGLDPLSPPTPRTSSKSPSSSSMTQKTSAFPSPPSRSPRYQPYSSDLGTTLARKLNISARFQTTDNPSPWKQKQTIDTIRATQSQINSLDNELSQRYQSKHAPSAYQHQDTRSLFGNTKRFLDYPKSGVVKNHPDGFVAYE